MKTFSLWWTRSPLRKWQLERVTKKYYSKYFQEFHGKTILEIGCGSGVGAAIISKYFSPNKLIATDLDPRLITFAKRNIRGQNITFEVADASNLPYRSNHFDAVFDYGAIHHIPSPDWRKCIQTMHRILKPGGKIFLYDLSLEFFDTPQGKIIKRMTTHPYSKMYKKQEFIDYLFKNEFEIISTVQESRYFVVIAEKANLPSQSHPISKKV